MEAIYWLVLMIIFIAVEIASMGLVSVWFAGGSLIAFIAAQLDAPIKLQIILFFVVSIVLLIATRPFTKKITNKEASRTNVDELIGKVLKVSEDIDNINGTGHVIVNGIEWMARAYEESVLIKQDTLVEVIEVKGTKLIVKEKI